MELHCKETSEQPGEAGTDSRSTARLKVTPVHARSLNMGPCCSDVALLCVPCGGRLCVAVEVAHWLHYPLVMNE